MLPRIRGDLRDLGLGDLECEDAADALAPGVHLQHNARRRRPIHVEDALQHIHDEFHGRVVVVQQDDLIKRWPLELRLGLFGNELVLTPCALFSHQRRRMLNSDSL